MLVVAAMFLVAGCGDDGSSEEGFTQTGTDTVTVTLPAVSAGEVYWLRSGKVWPVARELPATGTVEAALDALFAGPTDKEGADLGAKTAFPTDAVGGEFRVDGGVASLRLSSPTSEISRAALAQVVYTLTQFPQITSVRINGKPYMRADFEDQTPAILVESPLPFERVSFPVRATGTANTFEATFNYELVAPNGKVVFEDFVTATSGTGTRGTFEFTTDALDHPAEGAWALRVFERSAEDGSRTKLVEIPLRMSQ
jgi:immunoglobulin-like protein involved in spore germination/sporulation and spore germination protein